jgi:hypothetical protein
MQESIMFSLAAVIQNDGLTVGEVIRNMPHDAAAVFVYLLIGVFVYFIWKGSRSTGAPPKGG